jgi:hypothetical protein
MPTLTRLLLALALLAGVVLSAMGALVAFVRPEIVPITLSVPIPALQERRPAGSPAQAPALSPTGAPDAAAASTPQATPAQAPAQIPAQTPAQVPVEGLR